jgi:hypothetical protein
LLGRFCDIDKDDGEDDDDDDDDGDDGDGGNSFSNTQTANLLVADWLRAHQFPMKHYLLFISGYWTVRGISGLNTGPGIFIFVFVVFSSAFVFT